MTFQIQALPEDRFSHLFAMTDAELGANNACREVVTASPGTPCRISLADAAVGETVILVNYTHQNAASPYQASHAVYVREDVEQAKPAPGEVPEVFTSRLISVRMFNVAHMMIDADVVEGRDLSKKIPPCFGNEDVSYIHLHFAKPGCFAALVTKVQS